MFEAWNVAKGCKVQGGQILSQGTVYAFKYGDGLEDGTFNIQSILSISVLFVSVLNYILYIIQNLHKICQYEAWWCPDSLTLLSLNMLVLLCADCTPDYVWSVWVIFVDLKTILVIFRGDLFISSISLCLSEGLELTAGVSSPLSTSHTQSAVIFYF